MDSQPQFQTGYENGKLSLRINPFSGWGSYQLQIDQNDEQMIEALANKRNQQFDQKAKELIIDYEEEKTKTIKQKKIPLQQNRKGKEEFQYYISSLINKQMNLSTNGVGNLDINDQGLHHEDSQFKLWASLKDQKLFIKLNTTYGQISSYTTYEKEYTDDGLPPEVIKHLKNVETIYKCLQQKRYDIDRRGKIKIHLSDWSSTLALDELSSRNIYSIESEIAKLSSQFHHTVKDIGQAEKKQSKEFQEQYKQVIKQIRFVREEIMKEIGKMSVKFDDQVKTCQNQCQSNEKSSTFQIKSVREEIEKTKNDIQKDIEKAKKEVIRVSQLIMNSSIASSPFLTDESQFRFNRKSIVYEGKGLCHLFMNKAIPKNTSFQFNTLIKKTSNGNIKIGVVKHKQQVDKNNTFCSGNAVCYVGWSGLVYFGSCNQKKVKKLGRGFRKGQLVTMDVDLTAKTISWSVNNDVRAQIDLAMLGQPSTEWVPFYEFYDEGDQIQWSYP